MIAWESLHGRIEKIQQVQQVIEAQPQIDLAGLVRTLNPLQRQGQERLAVVAKNLFRLATETDSNPRETDFSL
ncbi:MAG: hypothetical protein F6K25_30430 [Okeania sp. SIO2G4]|uniref:hypothetical protein n=1 Tax=unclassified Okeania TaxID=2634635 RepID=UPI0013BC1673|nr:MULTISPECIES: hypothetical protein [unclassified Okeania]NEP07547.1 hypothetical protein [Okeania sp. SIO4D6]NEP44586.1 hypothetical protein [Okeania sp. SIO2H7]NEP76004.1 hypothetical protein [Okeania sp. SIO2G5]NEP97181.1 hypothetical protein [Okeania sp. SIO2F5]NEQ94716.1 hypothetical protein [Okeania sp. SIO2G4]